MPVYNAESSLRRSIDSILHQSFCDFELILVDDGSIDLSASICQEYLNEDARVKFLQQRNSGPSVARNTGLDCATAPWITFCDADDYVFPNWLQNFANSISDEYDLLIQGFETDRFLDSSFSTLQYGIDLDCDRTNAIIELYRNRIFGYLWVKAFRAEVVKNHQIKFDPTIRYLEDEIFILDYMRFVRQVRAITDTGYFYSVPDFDNKYKMSIDCSIHTWKTLNNRHSYFDGIQDYSFYKAVLGALSDAYIVKMFEEDSRNRHYYFRHIKGLLQTNGDHHPMNSRLRNMILSMPIDWVSYLILGSYYYTRKMFR